MILIPSTADYNTGRSFHQDIYIPVSYTHLDVYKRQLLYSSYAVSNAAPGLSPGLSHLTCTATDAPFTPSKSG